MSGILSQEEVTALLNAVDEGAFNDPPNCEAPHRGRSYIAEYMTCEHIEKVWRTGIADNRRNDQYSKPQKQLFTALFEEVAEKVAEDWSKFAKQKCEIELVSVDELTTSEFLSSVSNPGCMRLFKLPKATDCGVFEVSQACLIGMVAEEGQKVEDYFRLTLTDAEKQAGERLCLCLFDKVAKAFNTLPGIKFKFADKQYIKSPQRISVDAVPSNVLLVSMEVTMPNVSGLLSLAFPQSQVNFLLLTQQVKAVSECVKDNFSMMCKQCKLLQEYLKKEFKDLADEAVKGQA